MKSGGGSVTFDGGGLGDLEDELPGRDLWPRQHVMQVGDHLGAGEGQGGVLLVAERLARARGYGLTVPDHYLRISPRRASPTQRIVASCLVASLGSRLGSLLPIGPDQCVSTMPVQ